MVLKPTAWIPGPTPNQHPEILYNNKYINTYWIWECRHLQHQVSVLIFWVIHPIKLWTPLTFACENSNMIYSGLLESHVNCSRTLFCKCNNSIYAQHNLPYASERETIPISWVFIMIFRQLCGNSTQFYWQALPYRERQGFSETEKVLWRCWLSTYKALNPLAGPSSILRRNVLATWKCARQLATSFNTIMHLGPRNDGYFAMEYSTITTSPSEKMKMRLTISSIKWGPMCGQWLIWVILWTRNTTSRIMWSYQCPGSFRA